MNFTNVEKKPAQLAFCSTINPLQLARGLRRRQFGKGVNANTPSVQKMSGQ